MEFFKSGFKTVLGAGDPSQPPSAAETVEKLIDRIVSSTLLEDRRDACRALRAISRKYRIEVGAQGMSALVQILKYDGQDPEIISYALETLCNVISTEEFDEEKDNFTESVNVGEQFTEMFIKVPEHVSIVMGYLEEYDFRVRRAAIQVITILIANKTRDLQEIILVSPMGVSKMMDLLSDSREVIRNDALLLIIQLTKGNSNIQKIVAFENAFDKAFEIINVEGQCDGGIVVEDCFILLLNLLRNNSSNQQFFKEGSYIQRLAPMFVAISEGEDIDWSPQKVSNVHCMLQVVRALVTPNNQQQVVSSCQKIMRQSRLLEALCNILMCSGVPGDILTETINTAAEVIRGDQENQDDLSNVMAPSRPPRPAIVVLLMSMINEKQLLALRCAVLYCFQCYLYRNEKRQNSVIQTLLPSSEADATSHSTGQVLCIGLFSTNTLANWFSSVALAHALVDNSIQKEELLRVLLATPDGHKPVMLLEQCTFLLQQDSNKLQSKIGLLILLGTWLAHCPNAVKAFLSTPGTMAYLTTRISTNEHDENEYLVQGMCAFLIGLCIQFNDNSLPKLNRHDICQLVIKRIGHETFCNKLSEISRHETYSRTCKQPQIYATSPSDLLLDFEYCKLYKGLEALICKIISGFDVDNIELAELTLSSEASVLVDQYKGIIREQDKQINLKAETIKLLESKNREVEQRLSELESINTQLSDQNILLKAQLSAVHSSGETNSDQIVEPSKSQSDLCHPEIQRLLNEIKMLQQQLENEKAHSETAKEELHRLQKDQEDLLELLTDQENKITSYEQQLQVGANDKHGESNKNVEIEGLDN